MGDEHIPQFSSPAWLRDLGFTSWLLVGFVLIIVGLVWLVGETSTIAMPVILAAVLGAVTGPAVGWLERHRVPRIGGALLVLLGLVAIGILIFCLVFGGISANSGDISTKMNQSLEKIQGWLSDVGVDNAQSATEGVQKAAPEIRKTLLSGVAAGVEGLKSLVFFLAFAILSTLFVLKDGPVMHRFINRHLGVPEPVANIVTTNIAKSLRSYFLAVTIIAAFNAVLIGGAALILGVPLAGTITVVTFVGAYVPFVGAWVAGGFAVLIALSTGSSSDALIMAIVALLANGMLQQMIQPFVMGATLSLNPLVVLVVTIGAGSLFGMVGLTLAAPLTSAAVHIANELGRGGGRDAGASPAGRRGAAHGRLQLLPPAREDAVHARGAEDGARRYLEVRRVEDERARLDAAEPAVEADQLLEGAALFELGVVEAPHHDVGDMLEAVGAQQVLRRGGRERRERVLALDAAVREVVRAAGAERDRPVLGRADEQPADVGVRAEGGHELRVARLDLLERQPAALLHQVDEPEVARAEHDDVLVGHVVLGPLGRPSPSPR